MVNVSKEAESETQHRLALVLGRSRIRYLAEPYCFIEWPLYQGMGNDPRHLALVRDDAVWSALTPANGQGEASLFVWSIEFPEGQDNCGFVGWWATSLKIALGTGVVVICGFNSQRGRVFDYWACPWHLRTEAASHIQALSCAERVALKQR